MNNVVALLGVASISVFSSIAPLPARAKIPQTGIQEILIGGEANRIDQQLYQNLNLNFIYLPQLGRAAIPAFNIQGKFLGSADDRSDSVSQIIEQSILGLHPTETGLKAFGVDVFLNDDNILNGSQFIAQKVLLSGNNNSIVQQSNQTLTDFIWLGGSSDPITGGEDFSQLLNRILSDRELDSLQFGLQDISVFGNGNVVSQSIDQNLDKFIFTDRNLAPFFDPHSINGSMGLDPVQFTIQETFIPSGRDNRINQSISQVIGGISFFDTSAFDRGQSFGGQDDSGKKLEKNNSIDFDIDAFINAILNEIKVEATQVNRQQVRTSGDRNEVVQENFQEVSPVSIPEHNPNFFVIVVVLSIITGVQSFFKK